jgi:hypothetical protein
VCGRHETRACVVAQRVWKEDEIAHEAVQHSRQPAFGLPERGVLPPEQHVGKHHGTVDAAVACGPAGRRARHHRLLRRHGGREVGRLAAADIEPEHLVQADICRVHAETEQRHAADHADERERPVAVSDDGAYLEQSEQPERDQDGRARGIDDALESKWIRDLDLL